jgi:hypothetical protein
MAQAKAREVFRAIQSAKTRMGTLRTVGYSASPLMLGNRAFTENVKTIEHEYQQILARLEQATCEF